MLSLMRQVWEGKTNFFALPHHTRDGVPGISTPPWLAAHLAIITFQGGGLFLDLERVVQDNIAPFGESGESVALLGVLNRKPVGIR